MDQNVPDGPTPSRSTTFGEAKRILRRHKVATSLALSALACTGIWLATVYTLHASQQYLQDRRDVISRSIDGTIAAWKSTQKAYNDMSEWTGKRYCELANATGAERLRCMTEREKAKLKAQEARDKLAASQKAAESTKWWDERLWQPVNSRACDFLGGEMGASFCKASEAHNPAKQVKVCGPAIPGIPAKILQICR
ncbi:MAG: hypothetical protein EB121_09210, partial [Alphaproteobacteria bacterium]|nr:hypothetical protein [Alphaproteobacteria bacterium]